MKNISQDKKRVLEALAQNRTLWGRTFAPLRRAIAGTWQLRSGGAGLQLSLDAEGRFHLKNGSAGLAIDGNFAIAKLDSDLYLVLDSLSVSYVLRVEELGGHSMKLSWADEPETPLWFDKDPVGAILVPKLRMV